MQAFWRRSQDGQDANERQEVPFVHAIDNVVEWDAAAIRECTRVGSLFHIDDSSID